MSCVVIKLGGSVMAGLSQLASITDLISLYKVSYDHLIVVVSAFKGVTNQLLDMANSLDDAPPLREVDMLVSTGERVSASLLCIALHRCGIPALSYTGSQAGILTTAHHTNAKILDVQPRRLEQALQGGAVVVVAGFQGVSATTKEVTTLGRGGSDTTAVALALALNAQRAVFFKDVGALFNGDPRQDSQATPLAFCSYEQAQVYIDTSEHPPLHPRALHMAHAHGLPLHINPIDSPLDTGTLIAFNHLTRDKTTVTSPVYECDPAAGCLHRVSVEAGSGCACVI